MLDDFRKTFPFPVGTTSYIYPYEEDNLLRNVDSLKDKVDVIQLLFFGKDYIEEMCQKEIIERLSQNQKESGLLYALHLPIDFYLMECSDENLEDVLKKMQFIFDSTALLDIEHYILHIDFSKKVINTENLITFSDVFKKIIRLIKVRFENFLSRILIENTNYDLTKFTEYIVKEGFHICTDLGHLAIHNFPLDEFINAFRGHIKMFHLHGYFGRKDHQSLNIIEKDELEKMLSAVYELPVTTILEVFNENDLISSYEILKNYGMVHENNSNNVPINWELL